MLNNSIDVGVEFRHGKGLEPGTKVMFNGVAVGKVASIQANENSIDATLSLDADKSSAIQENAAAVINSEDMTYVEIINPAGTGVTIAEGATLYGLNSQLELAAWKTGVTFGAAAQMLEQVAESVTSYFESSEWEQTKADLQKQLTTLEQQSQQAMQGIAEDVAKEIDEAVKELESRSARATENAQKHFEELEKQLQEFESKGQTDLAETLQRILEQLQAAMQNQAAQQES